MERNPKSKRLSRRQFLQTGLAAVGGLALAGCRQSPPNPSQSMSTQSMSIQPTPMPISTSSPSIYLDPARPIEERVADLVGRMTLEEKVSQMISVAPAIPRLGVPQYNWWNEALHGVGRAGVATVFPQTIGLAGAWNTDLIRRMAEVISDEGRAKHHEAVRKGVRDLYTGLTFWSPNVNIFRDPRWGRGQETYGEDPYLTGQLGLQFVEGLQGTDPRYLKTVATPKHFAVHSGPENLRHSFDAKVSQRDLQMTYLPAFKVCMV
jgi:beta-glucosidase